MSEAAATPFVAVIIPFFQREPGLLRRALKSVAAQEGMDETVVRIIVVDDASPLSPAEDLCDLILPRGMAVETLVQRNGGAGSARNAGIDRAMALGCHYAAFLDSDDWWEPAHLATALLALKGGASFFFANSMHDEVPSFSYFAAMRALADRDAGTMSGKEAFGLLVCECFPHTSQVVYALADLGDVRFDETMRRTGEDHLFWLSVAARGAAFGWSTRVLGHRGSGVSVYRSALGWDSPNFVDRLMDAFRFRELVARSFALTPEEARVNARFRQEAADESAYALARLAVRSPRRALALVASVVRGGTKPVAAVVSAVPRLLSIRRRMGAM